MKVDEFVTSLQGTSSAARLFKEQVERACQLEHGPVLIEGERGTQTEEIALGIHRSSQFKAGKLLYLLGHSRFERDTGNVELPDSSALVKHVHRVSTDWLEKIFRLVSVAHQRKQWPHRLFVCSQIKLQWFVSLGHLDRQIYQWLSEHAVIVPSLRDRSEDIPILAEQLLSTACELLQRDPLQISSRALDELMAYTWPGNLAELQDVVQVLCWRARGTKIHQTDVEKVLPPVLRKVPLEELALEDVLHSKLQGFLHHIGHGTTTGLYDDFLAQVEPPLLKQILQRTSSNQIKAAALLGLNRNTLRKKLLQYGMLPKK